MEGLLYHLPDLGQYSSCHTSVIIWCTVLPCSSEPLHFLAFVPVNFFDNGAGAQWIGRTVCSCLLQGLVQLVRHCSQLERIIQRAALHLRVVGRPTGSQAGGEMADGVAKLVPVEQRAWTSASKTRRMQLNRVSGCHPFWMVKDVVEAQSTASIW